MSQIIVRVLSKKFTRAAPGVGLLAVTVTSFTFPSTSVRISFKKMTFCVPTFKRRFSNSERSRRGASLTGVMAIVINWSEYCSPSLARTVIVVSPLMSSSLVAKFRVNSFIEMSRSSGFVFSTIANIKSSEETMFPLLSVSDKYGSKYSDDVDASSTYCFSTPAHRGCPFSITLNRRVPTAVSVPSFTEISIPDAVGAPLTKRMFSKYTSISSVAGCHATKFGLLLVIVNWSSWVSASSMLFTIDTLVEV